MKGSGAETSFEGFKELVKSWTVFSIPEDLMEEVWEMDEREARRFYYFGLSVLLSVAILSLLLAPIIAVAFIVFIAVVPRLRKAGYKFILTWAKGLYLYGGDRLLKPQPRWIKALSFLIALFLLVFFVYLSFFGGG